MNVKISTLSPVHVGSGQLLHENIDFVTLSSASGASSWIQVVDDRKILELVGEKNLQNWLLCIERGQSIKEFVKTYAPNSKFIDYSLRRMSLYCKLNPGDTLKECIHNGSGLPYLPGSSIKGALRTAVTSVLASRLELDPARCRDKRGNFLGESVEKKLFGADPNHDIFRFLQCGDANFKKGSEVAFRLQMYLNITHSDSLVPIHDIKPQVIEAIGIESESVCQMKLSADYYNWIKKNNPEAVGNLPAEMQSMESLFTLVNQHTLRLVEEEIEYWSDSTKTGAEDYIDSMKDFKSQIKQSMADNGKSCILRMGHAIGWDFITGGWARNIQDFDRNVVPHIRPKNERYQEYDFPKSRRLATDSDVLGFVKLSIE